jgi:hypothetical protein
VHTWQRWFSRVTCYANSGVDAVVLLPYLLRVTRTAPILCVMMWEQLNCCCAASPGLLLPVLYAVQRASP